MLAGLLSQGLYFIEPDRVAVTKPKAAYFYPKDTAVIQRDVPQIPTVNPPGQALGEVETTREINIEAELSNSFDFYPLRTKSYLSQKIRFQLGKTTWTLALRYIHRYQV